MAKPSEPLLGRRLEHVPSQVELRAKAAARSLGIVVLIAQLLAIVRAVVREGPIITVRDVCDDQLQFGASLISHAESDGAAHTL